MNASSIILAERGDKAALEGGLHFTPKFDAQGLITAVAQDAQTGEILMIAYMNEESLRQTLALGEAVYYSRSRKEIWHKGATSGHVQKVVEIRTDCDQDALVLRVVQLGAGACHVGYRSCFYRKVGAADQGPVTLEFAAEHKSFDPDKVYK